MNDIIIIGGGIIGCAIARELSKYNLKISLLEKLDDVSLGASKANSGIIHGAYSAKLGTLKGEMCAAGNSLYEELNKELNFGYRKTGALVLAFNSEQVDELQNLLNNGIKQGEKDLEILPREELLKIEPNLGPDVISGFYSKSVGVCSPYEATIALMENAIVNGVSLNLNSEVVSITKKDDYFIVKTGSEEYLGKRVINCAGVYSDKIANLVGDYSFSIHPRKGQYILFGKDQGSLVNTVIFQAPTKMGKGVLVVKTFHNNLMIGPDAIDIESKEDKDTELLKLEEMIKTSRKSIPNFNLKSALTTFSGIRSCSNKGDFIIEESSVKGFINVGGIESPGLTSAPAISIKVRDILSSSGLILNLKKDFNPNRQSIIIKKDENFNGKIDHLDDSLNIICRCEKVTKLEILDSLSRGINFNTIDGIKRRTRAGMGFCQGNFCRPRVTEIISLIKNIPKDKISLRGERENKILRVPIEEIKKINENN